MIVGNKEYQQVPFALNSCFGYPKPKVGETYQHLVGLALEEGSGKTKKGILSVNKEISILHIKHTQQ